MVHTHDLTWSSRVVCTRADGHDYGQSSSTVCVTARIAELSDLLRLLGLSLSVADVHTSHIDCKG